MAMAVGSAALQNTCTQSRCPPDFEASSNPDFISCVKKAMNGNGSCCGTSKKTTSLRLTLF
jgi:hypothetical protein